MRRFLGNNLAINNGSSSLSSGSGSSSTTDGLPSPSPSPRTPTTPASTTSEQSNGSSLSSTKRAIQNTFAQLAYSRSVGKGSSSSSSTSSSTTPTVNSSGSTASLVVVDKSLHKDSDNDNGGRSPLPPTPPSKFMDKVSEALNEDTSFDDSSWDDAFKLPFGSSSLSNSVMIGSSDNASSSSNSYVSPLEFSKNNNIIDSRNNPDGVNNRSSTSTISAVRMNASHSVPHSQSSQDYGGGSSRNILSPPQSLTNSMMPPGLAVSATYAANASSLVDLKDDMMLELLSSDALIHVGQFEVLSLDEVEDLRKEHSILLNRLQSLQNKLTIETKIRDAALSISRLYASKRLSLRQKQAAEDELHNANNKVDFIFNETNKLARKESEIRTRILRHMAAVLALSFRKLESNIMGSASATGGSVPMHGSIGSNHIDASSAGTGTAPSSSAASSHIGPFTPTSVTFSPASSLHGVKSSAHSDKQVNHRSADKDFLSPKTIYSPTFSNSAMSSASDSIVKSGAISRSSSKSITRFEGAHFFANNKDAVVPITSLSPFTSPSLAQMAIFSSSTASSSSRSQTSHSAAHATDGHQRPDDINHNGTSPTMSTTSTTLPYMDVAALENQLQDANRQLQDATSQLEESRHQTTQLQASIDALTNDKADLASQLEALSQRNQKELQSNNRQLQATQQELQNLQRELKRLQALERQFEESREELASLRDIAVQLEQTRSDLRRANSRLETNIKDAGLWEEQSQKLHDNFEAERRSLVTAIMTTLQKHKGTSSALSRHLPDDRNVDLQRFVNNDLDIALRSLGEEHTRILEERDQLSRHIVSQQQATQQASTKSVEELRKVKVQVEQLQQEKQILMKKITRIDNENAEMRTSMKELSDEHDSSTARYAALQERFDASATQQLDSERRMAQKIQEVDKVHSERMMDRERALTAADQERRTLRGRLENLQAELADIRNEKLAFVQSLQDVWRSLPGESALQARLSLSDSDDIKKFKAIYLSAEAATTSSSSDRTSFSTDKLSKRIQSLLESDRKIISRLAAHEDHAAAHKASAQRAEKLLQESKLSLQEYAKQVQELSHRISQSDEKDITMLERLNDLQAALEVSRAASRRAEGKVQELEKKCIILEAEKKKAANNAEDKAKIAALEGRVNDLREELATAQDEVDELKSKESRQRVQLLDELSQLTEEASSLRAQLRTAQRKLATAGQ